MKIDILTLFPEMFKGPFDESILKRAHDKSLVEINIHNLRKWAKDKHKSVDDRPYGGGVGMILKVDILFDAISALTEQAKVNLNKKSRSTQTKRKHRIVLLDAGGETYTQKKALEYSKLDYLLLIAGHYEGVDHRVHEHLVDEVVSIGDYVLTGGEIPAMVIADSAVRLIPGVLEKEEATKSESFSSYYHTTVRGINAVLEYPQYTRPENFKRWKVPSVLLSGNHKKISEWKHKKSLELSKKRALSV